MTLQLLSSPSRLIGFIALHSFGISLIYPGSTPFLFYLSKLILKNYIEIDLILCYFYIVHENLMSGRRSLITSFGGMRYKLKTIDGNFIDSMFIDKRLILTSVFLIIVFIFF